VKNFPSRKVSKVNKIFASLEKNFSNTEKTPNFRLMEFCMHFFIIFKFQFLIPKTEIVSKNKDLFCFYTMVLDYLTQNSKLFGFALKLIWINNLSPNSMLDSSTLLNVQLTINFKLWWTAKTFSSMRSGTRKPCDSWR
jgi:hypothetical protein